MDPASTIARLLAAPMQPGRVEWIGLRIERRGAIQPVQEAPFDRADGIVGDRYAGRSGNRQVTLIQAEHLPAIAAYLGEQSVAPDRLRRNLVVSGLNLLAIRTGHLRIGPVLLEITGQCHPCSRMEEELGPGGYNAVRGHGGLTARVIEPGIVRLGDTVERCTLPTPCHDPAPYPCRAAPASHTAADRRDE
jgi:MOSC domain-containing protein YiiM